MPPGVLSAVPLGRGERVLAGTLAEDGSWLLGTRDALLLAPASVAAGHHLAATAPAHVVRIPWEQVQRADWDRDQERLRILEVGSFGQTRPRYDYRVADPGLLLELLRERVTASVVLQRRVVVEGRRGLYVVARRAPRRTGEVCWAYELDEGLDPQDPAVREAAQQGLLAAAEELGLRSPRI